jgi:AraC-like DNA-binding protein
MQYLTEWRMTLARDYLRSGDLSLAEIASRTGYTSAYAFAAAFRRHHGQPPGRWRQDHHDAQRMAEAPLFAVPRALSDDLSQSTF